MGTISQRKIDKIQDLKREGNSIAQIKRETGVSRNTVIKYSKGIIVDKPEGEEESTQRVAVPLEHVTRKANATVQAPKKPQEEPEEDFSNLLEDTPVEYVPNAEDVVVEVAGIPVSRKVQLNPKNLMMFGWFKERYNWEGDLSDFLNDTMTYFFENRLGAKVEINISEVV